VPVALTPERHDECYRDEELKQRATEEGEGFAAEGEDQVSGLVDREIEAVDPAVVGWCPQALPSVGRQGQRERGAPAPFPDRVVAWVLRISSAVCIAEASGLRHPDNFPTQNAGARGRMDRNEGLSHSTRCHDARE
jgi:hypothetical protein